MNNDIVREKTMYEEETIISVCVVQGEENFITRIADVRGNELILHAVDLSREYKGFNRDKLYYNRQMEPSLRKGHMGVWKWSVSSNHIEPGKERVSSEYQKYLSPVEVVDCRDKTKEELQVILKDGTLPQCSHQRMLWFRNGSREQGILCEPSKLEQTDNGVRIKGNVYGLPCYDIKESDLLRTRSTLGISERCLYRFLQLPQDSGYLSVRSPAKAVKDLLVKRLNWKFVKDHSLGTREDHKKFRRWMEVLPEQDIIEDIADCCHYSKREADACWKIFVDHIKQYVRCEDIETKVLQGLLEEDGNLQMRLKEEWHNTHRQELEREKTEYRKHRTEFEVERNTLEKEREELKAEQARLQREVEEAKACLDNVREEAKRYEELGRKSLEQVREKLSLAREEAAEFLANLALFGTPGEAASVSSITGRSTLMTRFLPGIVPKEWEPVVSVEEELEELKENLRQAGTDKEHLAELAAYLYGAFQNKTPLLLAGPQGIFVANAISCSMTGRYAAVLDCCGEWDSTLLDMARAQYLRRTPILLEALEKQLDEEGVLFREPYIESSPAYATVPNGLSHAALPGWMKDFFSRLSQASLGVYAKPFRHQVSALEQSVAGKDLFVSTGTGSGKTECFMWPLIAKLTREAHDSPRTWEKRGVRCIIMYPMNALVSDQISRLRRLLGDQEGRFVDLFREYAGSHARRPQFGMYTGRTPYPGPEKRLGEDQALAKTLARVLGNNRSSSYLEGLRKQGRIPAKADLAAFVAHLREGRHVTDPEDAELITRFEMQTTSPDILITNYSMLEYLLFRPREKNIWEDTRNWVNSSLENRLLFVIDEAHMYKGASGGGSCFAAEASLS